MSYYHRRRIRRQRRDMVPLAAALSSVVLSVTIVTLLGVGLLAGLVDDYLSSLPRLEEMEPRETGLTSKVYAADGSLIAVFHGEENRELVPLEKIPPHLIQAVIAIEDERFYEHSGFDLEAMLRALIANLRTGQIVQGGSTITQQYIKNVYISREKTLERKVREVFLAYQLEKEYSKKEILEFYLNTVYFGEGAYGVQTAAQEYFNKNAEELSLSESALLAGLIRSPAKYDPYLNEDAAISRRNLVLKKMVALGYITAEEAQRAVQSSLHLERPTIKTYDFAPYFVEHVKQMLIEERGADEVFRGGLKIYTTLDPKLQVMAEQAIAEILPEPEDPWAAVVAMDPKTGHILALVGGRDFNELKFNLATQGQRQPGSVAKVFVLVAALEAGYHPLLTFPPNGPLTFEMPGKDWEVDNYGGTSYNTAEMTIAEGTARSVNVVYAQLVMHLGAEKVIEVAKKMGVPPRWEPHPSVALGSLDISPLELAVVFSTLANYGVRNKPTAILKVVDRDGQVIYEHKPEGVQAISPINAYRVTEILKGVIQHGTGGRANIGRPAAGKTGTTQEAADAWFAGYTPDLTAVVWIGYPEKQRKMGVIRGVRVQGGSFPAMIWRAFMSGALQDRPATDFVKPQEDVIPVLVDKENGKLINRFTPAEEMELRHYRYDGVPLEQSERFMEKKILPDVVGMPWDQANHLLLVMEGFKDVELVPEPNPTVPAGVVHRQEPAGGSEIPSSTKIKLFYNQAQEGPPQPVVTLPDVVGMPWDQANHILVVGNGLQNVKRIAEPNLAVPAGVVHRQEPAGGRE